MEVKIIQGNKSVLGAFHRKVKKLRVAAYCRVSTDDEDQIKSYNSMVRYYTDLIKSNKQWVFAGVFADKAITGTKTDKREEFQLLIQECLSGNIDLVIAKSIPRFARNTLDTLKYVRMLRERNIAVYFEVEKINTLKDGEFLLTILSSVAQQEVENTSAYVKKGLKMKMKRGELVGFQGCLGYDYDVVTKSLSINEEGAETVRYIFDRYVAGAGSTMIARELNEQGIPTIKGNPWTSTSVMGIIKNEKYKFGVKFIYEPGYKKNIDLRRIYSHRIAAKNLMNLLEKEGDYDLLYAEIPPNDVALAAAEYAKKKGIPFVADVNDLWPEAMRMIIDIPVISDIIFYSLLRDAEKVYRLASGVIGTSDEYRDRPFKRRNRDIPRETVYVGNELTVFDAGAAQRTAEIVKDKEEFWVSYAGTIGTSYDIRTMVLAGEELAKRGMPQIKIKILGGGPMKEELEELANSRKISNVEFVGYAPYDLMAAYLKKSDILVNSFVKKAPQSIVTKIGDYLAAGKPMINTCMSPEFRAKVKNDGFGVNIIPEDVNILADMIEKLYKNEEARVKMGEKARKIAEEQFDRPKSYRKIEELIRGLIEKNQNRN